MSRLKDTFTRLHESGRKALVVYLTAGDPDVESTVAAAVAAVEAGADILEVGVPFSDPVADGPVIQRAMIRALSCGGGVEQALEVVRKISAVCEVPIVLFGYLNPLLWLGLGTACARLAEAGGDGLLVVDLPMEEAAEARELASAHGLDWVALVAPTTSADRARAIAEKASGFIYLVTMTGVTGGALTDVSRLTPMVDAIREVSDLPICVGFGVRDYGSAKRAAGVADGVVAGSVVVAALESGDGSQRVGECVKVLRQGVDDTRVEAT